MGILQLPFRSTLYFIMTKYVLVVILLFGGIYSAKLPSFIPRCNKNDNKCILAAANTAIPSLLDGYKPFKGRSANPFKFERFSLSDSPNLKIELTNGEVHNISTTEITFADITPDWKNWEIHSVLSCSLVADYEVTGQILILPIQGKGKCRIDFDKLEVEYHGTTHLVEKKGKSYMEMGEGSAKLKMRGMRAQFENLFNGDKALGDNINAFVNENWSDVEKEFDEGLQAIVIAAIHTVIDPIFAHVPKEDIILS